MTRETCETCRWFLAGSDTASRCNEPHAPRNAHGISGITVTAAAPACVWYTELTVSTDVPLSVPETQRKKRRTAQSKKCNLQMQDESAKPPKPHKTHDTKNTH